MIRLLKYGNMEIEYNLSYKNVKNINLRIKPDGSVNVSANRLIPQRVIDEFVLSKAEFIFKAIKKFELKTIETAHQYYDETQIKSVILSLCKKLYTYFEKLGVEYPQIKFRTMRSRWGSCNPSKRIVTFNINLIYAPPDCIEYVVAHEFTHFLQANHSKNFYLELEKIYPDWKDARKKLKYINIWG